MKNKKKKTCQIYKENISRLHTQSKKWDIINELCCHNLQKRRYKVNHYDLFFTHWISKNDKVRLQQFFWRYRLKSFLIFFKLLILYLFNNVAIVSAEQQRSQPYIHMYLFSTKLPLPPQSRRAWNIEQSSMFYTVGPYWLSVIHFKYKSFLYTWW